MKKIISLLLIVTLSACSKHDEHYYAAHPKALQQALANCPVRTEAALSCDQLKTLALRLNHLAYQLRMDQQAYGQSILKLQQKQSDYRKTLAQQANQPHIQQALNQVNQQIEEKLFVVKWLESPRSAA